MVQWDFYFSYEKYVAFILAFYDLRHLKLMSLILALRHHSCRTYRIAVQNCCWPVVDVLYVCILS